VAQPRNRPRFHLAVLATMRPAKNFSNPRALKTPKSSPLTHGFGRGIKGKKPRRVHTYIPYQIPKSKVQKMHQEIHQERSPKITTKNKREQHNQALRNHAESSIHHKEVHTRSSLSPDHPTLSQVLTQNSYPTSSTQQAEQAGFTHEQIPKRASQFP
jgi:hypothetical protein